MELIRQREWGEIGLRSAVVILVLAYAWLGAYSLESRIYVPEESFSYVVWVEGGKALTLQEASRQRSQEVSRIASELAPIDHELRLLGGLKEKIELTIHADQPTHYHVSENRIELGKDHAVARGQMAKAVFKSWVLQKTNSKISSSLLLTEVVSDSLLAMLRRGFWLELPLKEGGEARALELPRVDNWLGFARSFHSSCGSDWASLELRGYCGSSDAINPLSFRPLMVSMVWDAYSNLPALERISFVGSWAKRLQAPIKAASKDLTQPTRLADWRDWIREEFSDLRLEDPRLDENQYQKIIKSARLGEDQMPTVEYVIHGPEAPSLASGSKATIGSRGGVKVLLPSETQLSEEELKKVESRFLLWRDCDMPTLGEVLSFPVLSEKVIYLHSCNGTGFEAKNFVEMGPEKFLANHNDVPFVLMRKSALELAIRQGVLSSDSSVVELMRGTDLSGRGLLGLESAEWRSELKAFRVLGAIEAVELFRSYGAAVKNGIEESRF